MEAINNKIQAERDKFNRLMIMLGEEQQIEAKELYDEGYCADTITDLISNY